MADLTDRFGTMVFSEDVMKKWLPKDVYKKLAATIEGGEPLDLDVANAVAHAMKEWAISKGATHYAHWFQPLSGITSEKHDSFLEPNHFQTLSIITAFIGVLFIVKPTGNMNLIPALIGLMGGLGAGLAYTYVRSLGQQGVAGPFIVFFFSAFSCVVLLPFLIFDFHPMTWVQLGTLLFAGLSAAGGQFTITAAYCYAPAREISVFDYFQIPFSALLGFIVFGQIPDWLSWIGYAIICGTAIAMFLRTTRTEKA